MAKIRVLLTDDHTLFRQGVHTLLTAEPELEVVGEAANGAEAIAKSAEMKPDVVLMDVSMPGLSSFEATRQIRGDRPDAKVLFLTNWWRPSVRCIAAEAI
jgi:DNA-binding NarL/FixJ family response regulator